MTISRKGKTLGRFSTVVLSCGAMLVAGGCATKKFVSQGIAAQDQRISGLESQVEANQKQISQTGQKVDAADSKATEAQKLGGEAQSKANEASQTAEKALTLAKGKLLFQVVLSDTAGNFAFNSDKLSDSAKAELDKLGQRLKSENQNVWLEIEGHTDSTGPEQYNLALGQRRADAVRRYLNATYSIPLHKMSIISYGETKPVADNSTKEGRAQNRRVVIRVLS